MLSPPAPNNPTSPPARRRPTPAQRPHPHACPACAPSPCWPSHLFFALLVVLFTASLLVVRQLLPIGDAAEGDGEAPPRPEDGAGVMMRLSASRVALRAFGSESRLEAARSERRWWIGLAPIRLALVSAHSPNQLLYLTRQFVNCDASANTKYTSIFII
jgi:hypothetical protein